MTYYVTIDNEEKFYFAAVNINVRLAMNPRTRQTYIETEDQPCAWL